MIRPARDAELRANLTTFRDGKVIEMVAYANPEDALTAAGYRPFAELACGEAQGPPAPGGGSPGLISPPGKACRAACMRPCHTAFAPRSPVLKHI